MDSYEGSRSLDDLKNYLTLKISEHSLLSSATTENSETAEEIPSDELDLQVYMQTCLRLYAHTVIICTKKLLNSDWLRNECSTSVKRVQTCNTSAKLVTRVQITNGF